MKCPLCHQRPAKRACPALARDICATCCATKRLVEIRCPSTCPHLSTARRHPAAAVRRQQEHDLAVVMASLGHRPTEAELQLYLLLGSVILQHKPDLLAPLTDADVAAAAGALAGTLEAAGRGVIAELQAASRVGENLRREIQSFVDEARREVGPRLERDAAVVLRGIERAARHESAGVEPGERTFLTLLERLLPPPPEGAIAGTSPIVIL